ncbi:surfeit locus protein 2-like [Stylophora pistillata]|uniref:Surfeit locus protein 2 n=1 Tax=Stylophora pistillata TaxID=50429 RepID=A0A2B4REF6_STYPI|nr:surfeit locus protein 2-like [Stylophora pistillata]PFX15189.1 Surfeit locus protein 2 [Stylophora pistillata]
MADGKDIKKFLANHPHFELFKDDQMREKIRCNLTGHELPARLPDLENYIKGKKYQRLIKEIPDESPGYEEYKEYLVPSGKKGNQLHCQLTKKYINNVPHHIQRHITGKRFKRALEKLKRDKKLESEDADEDMWVPSDLESEPDEGDEEEKMDEVDSGGEFSSEDEDDTYERKNQTGLKRTLKETSKSEPAKKVKGSVTEFLPKDEGIKNRKTKNRKKAMKS